MFRLNANSDASAKTFPLHKLAVCSVKSDSSLYVRPDYSFDEEEKPTGAPKDEKPHSSNSGLCPYTRSSDSNDNKNTNCLDTMDSTTDLTAFFTPPTFSSNSNSTSSTDLMTVYPSTTSSLNLKSSLNLSSDIKPVNGKFELKPTSIFNSKANQLVSQLRDMTSRLKQAINSLENGLENKKIGCPVVSKKPGEIKQSIVRRIALKSANGHEFLGNLKTNSLSEHVKLLKMIVDDYVLLNKFIAQHSSSV
ncbi:hypothetical protein M3Y96_00438100 [Aphelenchoides besseyi]|nr:hypothetical protein M3Y96_00438100 [Aphelenchoides besseyi]